MVENSFYFFIENFFDERIYLVSFVLSAFLCYFFWRSRFLLKNNYYNKIQKIHFKETSRLGGVSLYLSLLISTFIFELQELHTIILFYLPIFIVATIEDVNHNVKPWIRFIVILISCSAYFVFFLKNLIIPFEIFQLFSKDLYNYLFAIFCLSLFSATVVNGSNMIDGANGLCSFYFLSVIFIIILILLKEEIYVNINSYVTLFFAITGFLIFNFPKGRIFLGDNGAYLLGFLTFMLSANYLKNQHNSISSFVVISFFFYPIFEVIFSMIRKIVTKKNPFEADDLHLHLLVYKIISSSRKPDEFSNALSTVFLSIIWLIPNLIILIFYNYYGAPIIFLINFIILYFCLYISISVYLKRNNEI